MAFLGGSWNSEKAERKRDKNLTLNYHDDDQYEEDMVKQTCENCGRNSTYNKYYSACIWTPDNPYRCSHHIKIK